MLALPWPPKPLSPNARVHWAVKSKSAKAYKMACWAEMRQYIAEGRWKSNGDGKKVNLSIEFVPPNKRGRDLDNCLASIKSGLDGVALAMGLDDKMFTLQLSIDQSRIGGIVYVTFS